MAKTLRLRQNDLQPYYRAKVEDSDGSAVDLTGASIVCTMKARGGSVKIDRQNAGINITGAAAGEFEYRWQAGDTDTVGPYDVEFEISPQSGGKFTVPAKAGEAEVIIAASLDSQ
jgi:hypothetical protein